MHNSAHPARFHRLFEQKPAGSQRECSRHGCRLRHDVRKPKVEVEARQMCQLALVKKNGKTRLPDETNRCINSPAQTPCDGRAKVFTDRLNFVSRHETKSVRPASITTRCESEAPLPIGRGASSPLQRGEKKLSSCLRGCPCWTIVVDVHWDQSIPI
jgi:hypothetical protein